MGVVANAIDRTAGTEREYSLGMDPTVFMFDRKLRTEYTSPIEPFMVDKPDGSVRTLLDRPCTHRKFEDAIFRRDAWMDPTIPSIYLDLFAARKGWEGLDQMIFGTRLGVADTAMPLEVRLFWRDENITMKVMSITQGPIDPKEFTITKNSFRK